MVATWLIQLYLNRYKLHINSAFFAIVFLKEGAVKW